MLRFVSLYLLKFFMDQVILCMLVDFGLKLVDFGQDHGIFKILVMVFIGPYLLNILKLCMLVDTCLKFYAVPSRPTWVTFRSRSQT